jgi:hypothetical protein
MYETTFKFRTEYETFLKTTKPSLVRYGTFFFQCGGRDIFFSHHTIRVIGSVPGRSIGQISQISQISQMDTTCLPVSVVVKLPNDVYGNFYLTSIVENKFNGIITLRSVRTMYLNTINMRNGLKIISLRRV